MESLGIPTRDGTPVEADPRKIWQRFAEHYYLFRGTPTGAWLDHELHDLFGVRDRARRRHRRSASTTRSPSGLASPEFRPRALFERFHIEVLATTDKASDSLDAPPRDSRLRLGAAASFRPSGPTRVFRIASPAGAPSSTRSAKAAGRPIADFASFVAALEDRRALLQVARRDGDRSRRSSSRTPRGSRRDDADALFARALHGDGDAGRPARVRSAHARWRWRACRSTTGS